jgi:hypothetical protein
MNKRVAAYNTAAADSTLSLCMTFEDGEVQVPQIIFSYV